jgi:hypothetical protein
VLVESDEHSWRGTTGSQENDRVQQHTKARDPCEIVPNCFYTVEVYVGKDSHRSRLCDRYYAVIVFRLYIPNLAPRGLLLLYYNHVTKLKHTSLVSELLRILLHVSESLIYPVIAVRM